jgi:hypothetical protein
MGRDVAHLFPKYLTFKSTPVIVNALWYCELVTWFFARVCCITLSMNVANVQRAFANCLYIARFEIFISVTAKTGIEAV